MITSIFIKNILQKTVTSFVIEWTDGNIAEYRLSDIQKKCTCAYCRDEKTGQMLIDSMQIDPDVRARKITSVGRYALKIEFTSGCSMGIYPFIQLYRMAYDS